jgi:diguanylate cyclase
MRYQHSREESAEILRRALQLMSPHRAGYHPVSYAVWYEHAAALNPDLTRELEKLLCADALLSDVEICRLHALHIAGRDVQVLELAQSELREVLGESEKQAAHAERTLKRFAAFLDEAVEHARGGTAGENPFAETVSRVLAEAFELQSVLDALHQQLATQRRQVAHVMERLERAQTEPLRDPLTASAAERSATT